LQLGPVITITISGPAGRGSEKLPGTLGIPRLCPVDINTGGQAASRERWPFPWRERANSPDGAGHTIRNLPEECDRSQFLRAVELNSFRAPTPRKRRSIRSARTAAGKMSEVEDENDGTRPERANSHEYPSHETHEVQW